MSADSATIPLEGSTASPAVPASPAQAFSGASSSELLDDGVVGIDAEWRFTHVSSAAERMLGRAAGELLGAPVWGALGGLDATPFGPAYRRAMEHRIEIRVEGRHPPLGARLEARVLPFRAGELLLLLRESEGQEGAADDSRTRRARLALLIGEVGEALTRSDTLKAMLQRCAEAMVRQLGAAFARVWTLDGTSRVLELQASAGLYTHVDGPHARVPVGKFKIGLIAAEGKPHLSNDVFEDARVGDQAWARREGMVAFAGYPLLLDGRVIGVLAMFSRTRLADDTLGALASVADSIALGIERKQSDQARQRTEMRLRLLAEIGTLLASSTDYAQTLERLATLAVPELADWSAVDILDEDGSIRRLALHHRDPAKVALGKELEQRFRPDPNDLHGVPNVIRTGQTEWMAEIPEAMLIAGTQDPELRRVILGMGLCSYVIVPLAAKGRVLGALSFVYEAASGRHYDENDVRLAEELARRAALSVDNARLFQEARRLIQALEKSNKELDQFAYVASHDLKAPLRGIANLSQWVEEDLAERMTDDARAQMHLLRGRVHRLEALIEGILQYSRAGRIKEKPKSVDVAALLEEVRELLAPAAGATVAILAGMPSLVTDRIPLQQVFMNLVGNALKHSKKADSRVVVGGQARGAVWEFFVQDDGPGVAPQFHDRIWGIFQTLEARDKVESTGIGLAVVRKIVESKGGQAWIESSEGQGATFKFTWPRHESAESREGRHG